MPPNPHPKLMMNETKASARSHPEHRGNSGICSPAAFIRGDELPTLYFIFLNLKSRPLRGVRFAGLYFASPPFASIRRFTAFSAAFMRAEVQEWFD